MSEPRALPGLRTRYHGPIATAGAMMRTTTLPAGQKVPVLGIGTWGMGERSQSRQREIDAVRLAFDSGLRLVDTAEMYGDGAAEEVVGAALEGRRQEAFIVSKVLPHHASRKGTIAACEASLRRLGTDYIDLYLLHWRGSVPLAETVRALEQLVSDGKIRHWGVSNFDTDDMEELFALAGGDSAQTNQVLYNLSRRGIEFDLLPWCAQRHVPIMAYSPLEQGRVLGDATLRKLAQERGVTSAQVALAWVLRHDDVIAIPKAATPDHVEQLRGVLDIVLSQEELAALDRAFAPPRRKVPLEMI
jgi:diketogulonate reductase-like aldo/keto reductase